MDPTFPPQVDLEQIVQSLIILAFAFLLALPIGWNRERSERNFGFRTFPLVAVSAAAYMLIGLTWVETSDGFARLLAGLMTGVGFLGGGTIVKTGLDVRGLSTAAAIWATAALGAAVAASRYEIAIVIAIVTYGVLTVLPAVGRRVDEKVDGDKDRPTESESDG